MVPKFKYFCGLLKLRLLYQIAVLLENFLNFLVLVRIEPAPKTFLTYRYLNVAIAKNRFLNHFRFNHYQLTNYDFIDVIDEKVKELIVCKLIMIKSKMI
jgi:hypothetical protein